MIDNIDNIDNPDDVDAFLAHHGVKGMKWGVRRGPDGVRPIARTLARSKFGKNAIDRARKAGKAVKKANTTDSDKTLDKAFSTGHKVALAGVALYLGAQYMPAIRATLVSGLNSAAARKTAAAGAKAAANILADSRGLTSYSTVALKFVDGVWK